jgi:hypothetical protein
MKASVSRRLSFSSLVYGPLDTSTFIGAMENVIHLALLRGFVAPQIIMATVFTSFMAKSGAGKTLYIMRENPIKE